MFIWMVYKTLSKITKLTPMERGVSPQGALYSH